jgi:uncharacterized protein (TIGR02466 family)
MGFDVLPLFSTPVASTFLEVDCSKILEIISQYDFEEYGTKNGYQSCNITVLDLPELKSLRNLIDIRVKQYLHDILRIEKDNKKNGTIEFYMHSSWVNLHKPGHFAQPHLHKNSMYSFVFYVDTCENCGDLYFSKPILTSTHGFSSYVFPFSDFTLLNSDSWDISPKKGMLWIFPASVLHGTYPNKGVRDRYSIVGNYSLKGTIGTDTSTVTFK